MATGRTDTEVDVVMASFLGLTFICTVPLSLLHGSTRGLHGPALQKVQAQPRYGGLLVVIGRVMGGVGTEPRFRHVSVQPKGRGQRYTDLWTLRYEILGLLRRLVCVSKCCL